MESFVLNDIVDQSNNGCPGGSPYNIMSQSNAGMYSLTREKHINHENCTYVDAVAEDFMCPQGQSPNTFYPLLNKGLCCEDHGNDELTGPNAPHNIDYMHSKYYPINYDLSQFYDKANFTAQQELNNVPDLVDATNKPQCYPHVNPETIDVDVIGHQPVIQEHQPLHLMPYQLGANGRVIEGMGQMAEQESCQVSMWYNLMYMVMFCLIMMIILLIIILLQRQK